jgi:hypothetical protein
MRSGNFISDVCASDDPSAAKYCQAYLNAATVIWKRWESCASGDADEQSFCAGSKAAKKRITEWDKSCNCSVGSLEDFRPELKDETQRFSEYSRRVQKYADELKAATATCPKDIRLNERFCLGYSAEVGKQIAELMAFSDAPALTKDIEQLGRADGAEDSAISLVGSGEFWETRTCITSRTSAEEMRKALLAFARDHPDQKDKHAIEMLGAALNRAFCGNTNAMRQLF